jgi:hypothetical protein
MLKGGRTLTIRIAVVKRRTNRNITKHSGKVRSANTCSCATSNITLVAPALTACAVAWARDRGSIAGAGYIRIFTSCASGIKINATISSCDIVNKEITIRPCVWIDALANGLLVRHTTLPDPETTTY